MHTNRLKSAITVVEDKRRGWVDHHGKKNGRRQDPSLWEKFDHGRNTDFLADSQCKDLTFCVCGAVQLEVIQGIWYALSDKREAGLKTLKIQICFLEIKTNYAQIPPSAQPKTKFQSSNRVKSVQKLWFNQYFHYLILWSGIVHCISWYLSMWKTNEKLACKLKGSSFLLSRAFFSSYLKAFPPHLSRTFLLQNLARHDFYLKTSISSHDWL